MPVKKVLFQTYLLGLYFFLFLMDILTKKKKRKIPQVLKGNGEKEKKLVENIHPRICYHRLLLWEMWMWGGGGIGAREVKLGGASMPRRRGGHRDKPPPPFSDTQDINLSLCIHKSTVSETQGCGGETRESISQPHSPPPIPKDRCSLS